MLTRRAVVHIAALFDIGGNVTGYYDAACRVAWWYSLLGYSTLTRGCLDLSGAFVGAIR